jgi:4-amino-4-deoxy-L-arabinose transferase-like glycosyltransferase
MSVSAPAGRLGWVVLLLAASLLVPLAAWRPLERQQELRVAICGRNMAQSGDWVVPVFQNQPRLRKPPLLYWLSGAAMRVSGRFDREVIARLPGLGFSLGLIAFVAFAGRRLVGRRAAVLGGAALVLTPLVLQYGPLAETDGAQALATAGAVVCSWRALAGGRRRGRAWLAAGAWAGLGVLAKSPASLLLPVLTLGLYLAGSRGRTRPQSWFLLLAGLLLAAALATPWYLAVSRWQATAPAARDAVAAEARALLQETGHPGSPAYYFYTLPLRLLPAAWVLPWALALAWRRRTRPGTRLLLCWFAATFVLLSALPSKQSHYVWLLAAPTALLVGAWLARRPWRARLETRLRRAAWLAPAVAALAWTQLPPPAGDEGWRPADLRQARLAVLAAPRVHVSGLNSAIFDFYLQRHVENTETVRQAWRQACPGEGVVAWLAPGEEPPPGLVSVGPLVHGLKPGRNRP